MLKLRILRSGLLKRKSERAHVSFARAFCNGSDNNPRMVILLASLVVMLRLDYPMGQPDYISKSKMGSILVTTTTKIFPKVVRYKWEAYCNTNGGRTAIQMGGVLTIFPFPQSLWGTTSIAVQLEAYCNTNGRCIAILFWEVVVVGGSDMLLKKRRKV